MAESEWRGDGPVFTIESVGRTWTLGLDRAGPCLSWSDGRSVARLLGLDHVAAIGRCDHAAFAGSSLVSFERHRGRVLATFAPPGWPGLSVRAAWGPTPDRDGFDLEVQVGASSTAVFRRLEMAIGSTFSAVSNAAVPWTRYRVEPRDRHAAALSYDGRESPAALHSLITMPVPAASTPSLPVQVYPMPGLVPGRYYVEMVQPNDCARRIIGEIVTDAIATPAPLGIRYGLFGLDLEKGVVLRGRVRGIWIDSPSPEQEARRRFDAFLREPPALGP